MSYYVRFETGAVLADAVNAVYPHPERPSPAYGFATYEEARNAACAFVKPYWARGERIRWDIRAK